MLGWFNTGSSWLLGPWGRLGSVALVVLSGCATNKPFDLDTIWKTSQVETAEKISKNPLQPIELDVSQAFFSEDTLKIKVRLKSLTELEAGQVVVGVLGLDEGEIVGEEYQKLSDLTDSPSVSKGRSFLFQFSLPANSLTEYQVRGSWGEDAVALLEAKAAYVANAEQRASLSSPNKQIQNPGAATEQTSARAESRTEDSNQPMHSSKAIPVPNATSEGLLLRSINVEESRIECDSPPCPFLFQIAAELKNNTRDAVSNILLAVGLYWVNEGAVPSVPEAGSGLKSNEELIDLAALRLKPGESKTVKIKVDREVPEVPGGRFIPHLRLLSSVSLKPQS